MGKVKKATAWWVGIVVMSALYLCTLIIEPEILKTIGGTIVGAISFATVGYIGGNVADNAVKGRYYRPELDRGEGK